MFCVRPHPLEGESLASFLYRVLEENGISSIHYLSSLLGIHVWKLIRNQLGEEDLKKIASITGKELMLLKRMTWKSDKLGLTSNQSIYIVVNKTKYCPDCVRINKYHKLIWNLYPVNLCVEHSMKLTDICLTCQQDMSMASLINGYCLKCGFNLETIEAEKIPSNSLFYRAQQDLYKLINRQESELVTLKPFSLNQFLEISQFSWHLLEGLKSFISEDEVSPVFKKKRQYKKNEDSLVAYSNIFWMFMDFPNNFYIVLDYYTRKEKLYKYKQRSYEKLLLQPEFREIHNAYKYYWKIQLRRVFFGC